MVTRSQDPAKPLQPRRSATVDSSFDTASMCGDNAVRTRTSILVGSKALPLNLRTYEDAEHFLGRCESWLLERSDILNTMYSAAVLIADGSRLFKGPYWFGSVEADNGDIVACGTHNLPNGLTFSEIPPDMLEEVYRSCVEAVGVPHLVRAPQSTANWVAEKICSAGNINTRFKARWLTYRVDDIIWPERNAPGRLRKGQPKEEDLIAEWGRAFGEEEPAPVDVSEFMRQKLDAGELYIWDDNGARTLLTLSGRVGEGIRISGVYTPPEFRRRGYASTAVAALSDAELRNGRSFVVLNVTDGNPAARLYQRLGYRLIGSSDCFQIVR